MNGSYFTSINPMAPKFKLMFSIKVKCIQIYLWNIKKTIYLWKIFQTLIIPIYHNYFIEYIFFPNILIYITYF